MKFIFDRDSMLKEISIAQEIIVNKSASSIASHILLIAENNSLIIKAVDQNVSFTTKIPVEIQDEGKTTIYCDKFMSILSSLPTGEVEFSQEDISVLIKPTNKKINFYLKSQTSDKFPEVRTGDNLNFFELPAKDFKEMIKETIFAVSDDKKRFFMTGVLFTKNEDTISMVATDGRRLSCDNKKGFVVPDFNQAIIPTKILTSVLKNAPDEGNIQIAVVEKSIFIKYMNVEFSSNLFDGSFPNYKKVIPENLQNSFTVNKNDLDSALKRIVIMVDKVVSKINFNISSGVLNIFSPDSVLGNANEEIPCRYDGPNIKVGLNYNYIKEVIKVIDSENIIFNFDINESKGDEEANITKAVIIKGDSSVDYIHVIMPMN